MNKKISPYFILLTTLLLFSIQSISAQIIDKAEAIKKSADGTLKFAYLADIHIAIGSTSIADIEASVKDINALDDIQFVILAGDITEFGSDEEIKIAASIFAKFNKPWFILSGNHDSKWSESGCNTFAKVFGYEFFDFVVGPEKNGGIQEGIRFIGNNSGPNMRMAPALVPRESILKLDSVSRVVPKDQIVIYINHYPLDEQMLNWFEVTGILKKMNTQLVMCGHGHNNMVLDFDGIPAVMGRSNLRTGRAGAGYNIVTIAGGIINFQERYIDIQNSQGKTLAPWFKLRMSEGSAYNNTQSSIKLKSIKEPLNQTFIEQNSNSTVREIWSIRDNFDIGSAALFVPNKITSSKSGDKIRGQEFEGIIYYANTEGVVKAVSFSADSLEPKKILWSYTTGGKIFSSPAVDKGRLVIGSSDGFIYCLNAINGNLVWKVAAKKSVLATAAIFKNIVYIGSSDGVFRAIDLISGSLVWSFDGVEGFVESKAFVDNSGVFFGSWGSHFYALNPKSGKLMWSWTNKKGRGLSPAAVWPVKTYSSHSKIFIVTPERITYALDAATGSELWREKGGRESIGISPNASVIYVKTMQDTVLAYNSENIPTLLWKSNTGFGYEISPSPITSTSQLVFIPTDKGDIFALRAIDGSVAWRYKFSIALINYIQPLPANKLLVSSMDGKVGVLQY